MPADGARASTYYDEPQGQPIEEARLVERIKEICAEWPSYGYRRVTAQLHANGILFNHKKVMRLMREHGLTVRPRRRYVATTDSDHAGPIFPNRAQGVVPTGPMNSGSPTSPTSRLRLASSIWQPSWTLGRDAWSAMPLAGASMLLGVGRVESGHRSPAATSRAASTIPIAARNMLPRTTVPNSKSMASRVRWAGAAIPTTMPKPRAS